MTTFKGAAANLIMIFASESYSSSIKLITWDCLFIKFLATVVLVSNYIYY